MADEMTHRLSLVDLLKLSIRVFKTKPARTLLTILGMSVGIGAVVFLISLGYGLQFILIGKLVTTEDSIKTVEVAYPGESGLVIDAAALEKIKSIPGATEVSPLAEFPAEMRVGENTGLIIAKIVDDSYYRLSGTLPDIGFAGYGYREFEPAVVISNQAAKLANLPVDALALDRELSFKVLFQREGEAFLEEATTTAMMKLKGLITDDSQPPFAILPAQHLSKVPPFYKSVFVKAKDLDSVVTLRDALIDKGFITSARVDLVNQAKKVMNIITIILGVFGVTALVVSAIGMFNTMIVGFMERIYEVGIMKSLGAADRDIKNLFFMESFVMGVSGGIGGVLLGIFGGQFGNFLLGLFAKNFGGKPIELFITPWWFVFTCVALSAVIGLIAGYWPARRASYLSPKEAFKEK